MQTRYFYRKGSWRSIANCPGYGLGARELAALTLYIPIATNQLPEELAILHLGIGSSREIPHLIDAMPGIKEYVLNDICHETVEETFQELRSAYPDIPFLPVCQDIEHRGAISSIRKQLHHPTLFCLIGNGVILANPMIDEEIHRAMQPGDYFLLTLETKHKDMFASYNIPPVYNLLSRSGLAASQENTRIIYDRITHSLQMICQGEPLLTSYKPTVRALNERMASSGFHLINQQVYPELHMIAGLYTK